MSYCWFNRKKILERAKEKCHSSDKEKDTEYYQPNRGVMKEKARQKFKNLTEEEKEAKRR